MNKLNMMQVLRMVLVAGVLGCSAGSMAVNEGDKLEEVQGWGPLTLIVLVVLMSVVCMMKKTPVTSGLCLLLAAGVLGVSVFVVIQQSHNVEQDHRDTPAPTEPKNADGFANKSKEEDRQIAILNVSAGAVGIVLGGMVLLECILPMSNPLRRRGSPRRGASPRRGRK